MTALDGSSRVAAIDRATSARAAGVAFLLDHIGPDGSVARTDARITWYRVPWAFAVAGEVDAAHRVLAWIEQHCVDEHGHFHGGIELDPDLNHTSNTYPETCLAYGAMLLRRFDLARRLMNAASSGFDIESGGAYMDRRDQDVDGGQLLFLTSQYGMSAAITGLVDDARRVGEWLERLLEAQPDFPNRLYTMWSRQSGLLIDVPEGENPSHIVNIASEEQQYHYNGGIAAAALVHIWMVTGEDRWLKLARTYQSFSIQSTPLQFNTRQVCKSAWGSGLLTLAIRNGDYEDWLIGMANWFADLQRADGSWTNTPGLDPNPTESRLVEITAEFVVHLDTTIAALAFLDQRSGTTTTA
jgi:hypothetical protein